MGGVSSSFPEKIQMITINVTNLGKRFNREWIFRNLTKEFTAGRAYALTGPNGSGKSTLLQILGGAAIFSEGTINYRFHDKALDLPEVYKYISLTAPYLEVIEEMTLLEFLSFHNGLKPWLEGINSLDIISACGLENAASKQIRYYSSGMKQRVKLAQAIFSKSAIVLLDEPCTNLDEPGVRLYHSLIEKYRGDRLLIIASNDKVEYNFCDDLIELKKH